MPSINLISFADGPFSERKSNFIEQASKMNVYDNVFINNSTTIDSSFFRAHSKFFADNTRGFGYWLWKPKIIMDQLHNLKHNDILVYADIGFTQNSGGRDRLLDYFQIVRESRFGLLSFMHPYSEIFWTKRDLAIRLGVDQDATIMLTSQLGGGLIIFRKCDHVIDLVQDWLSLSIEQDYHFLTDSPSCHPNDTRFVEHRHDQSISSLLRKMRGTELTFYESEPFHYAFDRFGHTWPMIATRQQV